MAWRDDRGEPRQQNQKSEIRKKEKKLKSWKKKNRRKCNFIVNIEESVHDFICFNNVLPLYSALITSHLSKRTCFLPYKVFKGVTFFQTYNQRFKIAITSSGMKSSSNCVNFVRNYIYIYICN